jgi:hypothetical protein
MLLYKIYLGKKAISTISHTGHKSLNALEIISANGVLVTEARSAALPCCAGLKSPFRSHVRVEVRNETKRSPKSLRGEAFVNTLLKALLNRPIPKDPLGQC